MDFIVATEVDEYGETGGDQSLFSGSETQTTTENPCNPQFTSMVKEHEKLRSYCTD